MPDTILEIPRDSSPPSPRSRLEEAVARLWGEVGEPKSSESLLQFWSQDFDPYQEIAHLLLGSSPVDEDLSKFNQFESVQIIARLRRVQGEDFAKSQELAQQILRVNFERGISDRHAPFFNAQQRAVMQDLGQTATVREMLLRAISAHMTSSQLMSCRRLVNEADRRNHARWFDSLIEQRNAENFGGFAPECLRQIRETLSSRWCEGNLFAVPSVSKKIFPALLENPLPVFGLEAAVLKQIQSSKYINRVIHHLQNCLGGYRRAILDGTVTILCLELNDVPSEVIEVDREKMQVRQWAGKQNAPPGSKTKKAITSTLDKLGITL